MPHDDSGPDFIDRTLLSRLLAEMPADVRARMSAQPTTSAPGALPDVSPNVETVEDALERQALARARRRAQWEARCPSMYRDARVHQLDPDDQHPERVAGWLGSRHRTLVLHGEEQGNGKTHAAYAVGHQAVERGLWTLAYTAVGLNRALRPDGESGAFEVTCDCDVLILDDLGRESDSPWTQEQLQELLNQRGVEGKRTVVTTNLSGEAMVERYGDPVVGRLTDDAVILAFTGPTRRRPAPW